MNIIIAGCGKVGTNLAETLNQEGHDITLIDKDSEILQSTSNTLDVLGIAGNAASHSILSEAGIDNAHLLIAVTESDELNLLCCLIAKQAGNCNTIARVRDPIYNKEIAFIKQKLGLSMVINPEFAAADEIRNILQFPSAARVDSFSKGRVKILKHQIEPGCMLDNMSLMQISNKLHCNVLICAVERGDEVIIPSGDFILKAHDVIFISATTQHYSAFFKAIGYNVHQVKNVMIIGGSTIAFYLAKMLMEINIEVKIIEKSRSRCEELSMQLPKAIIINADATDKDVLIEEGIENAQSFVALTNLDEENIMLALFARSVSKAKLVTKVKRLTFEHVVSELHLDSVISPKHITSEHIIQYVRAFENSLGSNVETLYKLIENKAEALEFYVRERSELVNVPLQDLELKPNLLISCIVRSGQIITPCGQDYIMVGDTVIVVTSHIGLQDIKDILNHR